MAGPEKLLDLVADNRLLIVSNRDVRPFMKRIWDQVKERVWLRRSLGLTWHLLGVVTCYFFAFQIRFDFDWQGIGKNAFEETLPFAIIVFFTAVFAFRLYEGLWRFFTFRDCIVTAVAFAAGTIVLSLFLFAWKGLSFGGYPRSILLINFLLLLGWEIGGRGFVRYYREWRVERHALRLGTPHRKIIAVGGPDECDQLIRSCARTGAQMGRMVALVTEQKRHQGGHIHRVPIYAGIEGLGRLVADKEASTVLILPPFTRPNRIREVMDAVASEKISCEFRVIPSYDEVAAGKVDVNQIRRVEIEDLLERAPYRLAEERMRSFVQDKRVLVTGAGGSIGSEICRQLIKLAPKSLVLFDVSEFQLFRIDSELAKAQSETRIVACAGDILHEDEVRRAIRMVGGIDVIYHAAAFKHVDLMERNPGPCFHNNVLGTEVIARLAESEGVQDFVLISSDKAVRPTSLMGASKRLAERLVMERPVNGTRFKAVRFGNVLGSSGSVVPIFREQIAAGGPVTVTSPNVTRFFMTIPEAVELVLAAGAVGEDRRICVLEMGNPVKIETLARRMIELSGLVPDEDIHIQYIGLKRGEKEHEELLTEDEGVERTAHDRIWVVKAEDAMQVERVNVEKLRTLIVGGNDEALRRYVHSLIPGSLLLAGS